jgi:hypothetical protein
MDVITTEAPDYDTAKADLEDPRPRRLADAVRPFALMAGRRGGKALDSETALNVSLNGTSLRLVYEKTPTLQTVQQLRAIAGDRTDMLAKVAGTMIGGYLGSSMAHPADLAAAHLLLLASNGDHHDLLVTTADQTRRNTGGSAYSL